MKIDLNEIWEFMEMAPEPLQANQGKSWIYELIAGDIVIQNLSSRDIQNLKKEENYDTELLPSIFTFREILWQPNVYTQPALCVPQLSILKVFCNDYVESLKQSQNEEVWLYFDLLNGLSTYCEEAIDSINKAVKTEDIRIPSILGELRRKSFPIVKFFIFHPMNRRDYKTDALNRLNYAVKIMLTQYNNHYYDLRDPYWKVTIGDSEDLLKTNKYLIASNSPSTEGKDELVPIDIQKNNLHENS
ncbi:hypothetical protein [Reichenbachiella agariperforans]|uniref:hypothetical protein n=1 Tax=Reichenbachiella agariperforans TaxID=156994 RepID=UPI001C08C800|nr:hypothetical protein [Reichenbachiella agariperforans]MBU2915093.1 hypothetical protein [Reichenbachiella agariperforans]